MSAWQDFIYYKLIHFFSEANEMPLPHWSIIQCSGSNEAIALFQLTVLKNHYLKKNSDLSKI